MNIRTFVAKLQFLSRNPQYDFPKMRGGGGKRPFGTFPKIHPFWSGRPSLSICCKVYSLFSFNNFYFFPCVFPSFSGCDRHRLPHFILALAPNIISQ